MNIQKRDLVLSIILSFITCGIYPIYWLICLTDDCKAVTNDNSLPSGAMAFLLSLITCGIYTIYLFYILGQSLYKNSITKEDRSIIYLLLSLFGLSIINFALLQDDLNHYIESNGNIV